MKLFKFLILTKTVSSNKENDKKKFQETTGGLSQFYALF